MRDHFDNHITVDQSEGCAIWIIAIVMIWIAFMLRGYMRQQVQTTPFPQQIEQQEASNEQPAT